MIFRNFTGSKTVQNQISCLLGSGRLPHAIVLEGAPGAGKMTLARDIAAALVCKAAGERPCGVCPACKKAYASSHPDIFEYEAKNTPKSFPVSVVRDVRSDVYIVPNEADYKVYLLGNASSMGREAQNALLKTLEEPPDNVILILTVTSKTLLLDTVLSRSVVFTLEEPEGTVEEQILPIAEALAEAFLAGDEYRMLTAVAPFEGNRDNLRKLTQALNSLFRKALLQNAGVAPGHKEPPLATRMAGALSKVQLMAALETLGWIQEDLNRNANQTLAVTKLVCTLKQAILN